MKKYNIDLGYNTIVGENIYIVLRNKEFVITYKNDSNKNKKYKNINKNNNIINKNKNKILSYGKSSILTSENITGKKRKFSALQF